MYFWAKQARNGPGRPSEGDPAYGSTGTDLSTKATIVLRSDCRRTSSALYYWIGELDRIARRTHKFTNFPVDHWYGSLECRDGSHPWRCRGRASCCTGCKVTTNEKHDADSRGIDHYGKHKDHLCFGGFERGHHNSSFRKIILK